MLQLNQLPASAREALYRFTLSAHDWAIATSRAARDTLLIEYDAQFSVTDTMLLTDGVYVVAGWKA